MNNMKYRFLQTKFVNLLLFCTVFGLFFSAVVLPAQAQTTTFAQFLERGGTQDFALTNNSSNAMFNTVSGGSSVYFLYQNISGLDSSLQGFQNAHLLITTTMTTTPATLSSNTLTQPLDQTTVIRVLRDTPTAPGVGMGARTNLLTATISTNTGTPALTGTSTGNSGTFSVTTPDHVVTFSSDFVNFYPTTQRNLALSFSSVTPSLGLGSGNFLQSFTAAGSGTFASNPSPSVLGPTASSVTISGRVLTRSGRGLNGARVNLTEENGTTRTVFTNPFGYYRFLEVRAGQSAIIWADSKRYSYFPQFITINEDVNDLNFVVQ